MTWSPSWCKRCNLGMTQMETSLDKGTRLLQMVCVCCDPRFQKGTLNDCHHGVRRVDGIQVEGNELPTRTIHSEDPGLPGLRGPQDSYLSDRPDD